MKKLSFVSGYLSCLAIILAVNLGVGAIVIGNIPEKEILIWFAVLMSLVESALFGLIFLITEYDYKKSIAVYEELEQYYNRAKQATNKTDCAIIFYALREYGAKYCRHVGHHNKVREIFEYIRGKYNAL